MGTFEDFVRYGLPGYIFVASALFASAIMGLLPNNYEVYKDFADIVGAALLIIGPLIGFIIHQVYFVYFDWKESYTKPTRGCIGFIYDSYIQSAKYKANSIDKNMVRAQSFIAWKFLTTNFEKDFKIDSLFINRLRNLRNYSHSFGSIVTSSIFSVVFGILIFFFALHGPAEFTADEFRYGLSVSALCKAINDDKYGIALKEPDNSIKRLNELLQTANFYDLWIQKGKQVDLPEELRDLITTTASYRNTNFTALNQLQKENILKLNRVIIEKSYPQASPKKPWDKKPYIYLFFAVHLIICALFYSKRKELMKRINELEIGIVLFQKDSFVEYLDKLIRLESDNYDILKKIRE
jgi:hypothetical protein